MLIYDVIEKVFSVLVGFLKDSKNEKCWVIFLLLKIFFEYDYICIVLKVLCLLLNINYLEFYGNFDLSFFMIWVSFGFSLLLL